MNAKAETEVIQYINLNDLQADPNQPRKYFDKAALKELADDINARGIIEPIIYFIDENGNNTILAGERRYRAAKILKLESAPCLLREGGDPMNRMMDQISENFQREGLNAIEMAMFFTRLVDDFKVKPTKIGEKCFEYGFKKFERSYISNIRRLLLLPAWAQTLIQQGQLTAAHGKYLLQALASSKVMKDAQAFLKKQPDATTEDLQDKIRESYEKYHLDVRHGRHNDEQGYGYISTVFDYKKDCKDCKTCQPMKLSWGGTRLFCINEKCYDKKQAAAQKKVAAAEERKNKAAETRRKNALKKEAEKKGISVEELEKAEAVLSSPMDESRASGRIQRTQEYLDSWLRPRIKDHLLEDEATRYQVVLWIAMGSPDDYSLAGHIDIEDSFETKDEISGINITLKQAVDTAQLEVMTCNQAIEKMNRDCLRDLAHHCEIKLEGNYTVDQEYLNIKLKDDLIKTTPEALVQSDGADHWENICKKDKGTIIVHILNREHLYGVPADLEQMYNNKEE